MVSVLKKTLVWGVQTTIGWELHLIGYDAMIVRHNFLCHRKKNVS